MNIKIRMALIDYEKCLIGYVRYFYMQRMFTLIRSSQIIRSRRVLVKERVLQEYKRRC